MRSATVLLLAAILPAAGPAQREDGPASSRRRGAGSTVTRIDRPGQEDPGATKLFESRYRERFLAPFSSPPPVADANPLEGYLPGESYPRALEAVATHLVLREAGRQWRRLAGKSLKDRYTADPGYTPQELAIDMQKIREGWGRRKLPRSPRPSLGARQAAGSRRRSSPNLVENRFFSIDQDLRLRFNLQEMVGIVIGEAPEDDYTFEPLAAGTANAASSRTRSRLPRLQIRGGFLLHLDREGVAGGHSPDRLFDRYGGRVSVDLLSRRSPGEKILSAAIELSRSDEHGTELVVGLTRRF